MDDLSKAIQEMAQVLDEETASVVKKIRSSARGLAEGFDKVKSRYPEVDLKMFVPTVGVLVKRVNEKLKEDTIKWQTRT